MANRLKRCGHRGCSLNTPGCCGCEDKRPITKYYGGYLDGLGLYRDEADNARYKGYCPTCRSQFENLCKNVGWKRCSCGIALCDLTTDGCCICLDKRPVRDTCYRYEDGNGMCSICATRWMHYCGHCQKRSKRHSVQMEESNPSNTTKTVTSKKRKTACCFFRETKVGPTAASNYSSTSTTTVTVGTTSTKEASVTPTDTLPACDAISDYEMISYAEASFDEKVVTHIVEIQQVEKKINGSWLPFFWKR